MKKYINSILDSDLYKYTMQNFALKLFPREIVRYDFINRDHREFPEGFNKLLRQAVDTMSDLALTQDEYDFIRSKCYYIDQSYVDFLKGYRFNPEEVIISQDGPNTLGSSPHGYNQ